MLDTLTPVELQSLLWCLSVKVINQRGDVLAQIGVIYFGIILWVRVNFNKIGLPTPQPRVLILPFQMG